MPESKLVFKAIDDGSIEAIARKAEVTLRRLQVTSEEVAKSAANPFKNASQQIERAAQIAEKMGVQTSASLAKGLKDGAKKFSPEIVSSIVEPLASGMGQASPILSRLAMGFTRFSDGMAGASVKTQVLARGLVGLGIVAAGAMEQFAESQRIATRFAEIDKTIGARDFGGMTSGIRATTIELEALDRTMGSTMGRMTMGVQSVIRTALGLPNAFEEASQALSKLRGGLEASQGSRMGGEEAQHQVTMLGLGMEWRRQIVGSKLATGEAGEGTIALTAGKLREGIEAQTRAAEQVLWNKRQQEFLEAGPNVDILGKEITARYERAKDELAQQARIQQLGVEEWQRSQMEGFKSRTEQVRATIAQSGLARSQAQMEGQQTLSDSLRRQIETLETRVDRSITAGRPDFNIPGRPDITGKENLGYRSNPALYQYAGAVQMSLIAQQRELTLKTIDETTTKQIAAIGQMAIAQEQRDRMIAETQATSYSQRQAAIDKARESEAALTQELRAQRDAAYGVGQAIKASITTSLEQAQAAAEQIAGDILGATRGGSGLGGANPASQPGSGPGMSLDSYWQRIAAKTGASSMDMQTIYDWQRAGVNISEAQKQAYMTASAIGDQFALSKLRSAWETQLNAGLNPNFQGGSGWSGTGGYDAAESHADGALFNTRGRTRMTVGEAGTETVAVLRNPRSVDVGGAGGGDLVVQMVLDGRTVVGTIRTPLQDAIRTGKVQVRA